MFAYSSEAPLAKLTQLTREINALEARRVQAAAEYERSRVWTNKYRNAACGIADACNVTEGVARIWLEIAHTLEDLPKTADAFDNGDISQDKAKAISKAATPDRLDELQDSEDELLDARRSRRPKSSPTESRTSPTVSMATTGSPKTSARSISGASIL
jgi:hypothetical protein